MALESVAVQSTTVVTCSVLDRAAAISVFSGNDSGIHAWRIHEKTDQDANLVKAAYPVALSAAEDLFAIIRRTIRRQVRDSTIATAIAAAMHTADAAAFAQKGAVPVSVIHRCMLIHSVCISSPLFFLREYIIFGADRS
jgi:hypothetical protein